MGKYICLCGVTHKDKETANLHVAMYEDIALAEGFSRHKTFKQHWKARLSTWIFGKPRKKISHSVGAYLIYFVLIHHFHIDLELVGSDVNRRWHGFLHRIREYMDIEDIEDHFCQDDNWWGSFDCPNCNQAWGPSNHGDPPATEDVNVRCDCGAVLRVSGEWVSEYRIDAEELDDE